jgi:hypothetical protein
MARSITAAGAAVLRAARMRVAQVKFPSDLAIGVRELVGTGRGFRRSSATKARFHEP